MLNRKISFVGLSSIYFFLITSIAFYFLAFCDFITYDDALYVYQNAKIHDLSLPGLAKIFFTPHAYGYTPLPLVTYALEYPISGNEPWLYHINNVLLHGVASYLVFLFFRLFVKSNIAAWAGGSLFAIHPLQVETVAWISIRKGILCLIFFLLSALFYARIKPDRQKLYVALSLACFALSLFSMMYALLLPAVFLIMESRGLLPKRSLKIHAPFWGLSLIFFGIWMMSHPASKMTSLSIPDLLVRLHHVAYAAFFYLWKIVWPFNYSIFYPRPEFTPGASPATLLFLPALLFLVAFCAWRFRARFPVFFFGAAFFALAILPLLPFFDHTHSMTQDHYAYIASVGVFLMVARALDLLFRRGSLVTCVLILAVSALISFLGLNTQRHCKTWLTTETVANQTLKLYPDLAPAYFLRGEYRRALGRYDEALEDFNRAIALRPEVWVAYEYRGLTYRDMERDDLKRKDFAESLRIQADPKGRRVY